jgi:hypothetical protein
MPPVGFEPMIPVYERAKTFHALYRAATVTGLFILVLFNYAFNISDYVTSNYRVISEYRLGNDVKGSDLCLI